MVKTKRKNGRGKCLLVNSVGSESEGYFMDDRAVSDACLSTKTLKEHVYEYKKVIDMVHSILKSLDNISVSRYN